MNWSVTSNEEKIKIDKTKIYAIFEYEWNSGYLSGESDDWFRELSVGENIWNSGYLSGETDDWFRELSVGENIWNSG
jgi:hypothetical protein